MLISNLHVVAVVVFLSLQTRDRSVSWSMSRLIPTIILGHNDLIHAKWPRQVKVKPAVTDLFCSINAAWLKCDFVRYHQTWWLLLAECKARVACVKGARCPYVGVPEANCWTKLPPPRLYDIAAPLWCCLLLPLLLSWEEEIPFRHTRRLRVEPHKKLVDVWPIGDHSLLPKRLPTVDSNAFLLRAREYARTGM